MQTTILLDHDIEGHATYLQTGLRETGWDQDLTIEFRRLRDLGLPDDSSDQDIWRFAQQHRLLQNERDPDAMSANTRPAKTAVWIDGNPGQQFGSGHDDLSVSVTPI